MGGWIYIGSGVVFLVFGSAKVQPWNNPDETVMGNHKNEKNCLECTTLKSVKMNPDDRLSEMSGEVRETS